MSRPIISCNGRLLETLVAEGIGFIVVRDTLKRLMDQLRALPKDGDVYGLIHGDFNDGNFTVDYENGDITVFDFDDCCYFWFMYELACAWEGGVGRAMFQPLDAEWLARLPLFLQVVQMDGARRQEIQ